MRDLDDRLASLLTTAGALRASDVHLTVGLAPVVRVDGNLGHPGDLPVLTEGDVEMMIRSTLDEPGWQTLVTQRSYDYSMATRGSGRWRVNAYFHRTGLGAAFRAINVELPTLEQIGAPPALDRLVAAPWGLVLSVGPTGSGKTVTQAAMINRINDTRPCHVLTLEDPIEYLHPHRMAMVHQREVGTDVHDFHDGLRAALREDPDVILVGEMRDLESIAHTLTLAETGHLVFATLHANDAAQAIDRIVDVFPGDRRQLIQTQLAGTLQGVISQRLVPAVAGGRVAAFETAVVSDAIANLIREGKTRQIRNVISTGAGDGMQTLEQALSALVAAGTVRYEDACAVSQFPKAIDVPMTGAPGSPPPPLAPPTPGR